jgi:hypothetical protein
LKNRKILAYSKIIKKLIWIKKFFYFLEIERQSYRYKETLLGDFESCNKLSDMLEEGLESGNLVGNFNVEQLYLTKWYFSIVSDILSIWYQSFAYFDISLNPVPLNMISSLLLIISRDRKNENCFSQIKKTLDIMIIEKKNFDKFLKENILVITVLQNLSIEIRNSVENRLKIFKLEL